MYLTHALHRAVRYWGDDILTVDADRAFTSTQSATRVARLAGALRTLGVGDNDRVSIVALNSDRHHEVFFASWWAGAVPSPLNTRWSATEITYALNDSGTKVVFVDEAFAAMVPVLREQVPGLEAIVYVGRGEAPQGTLVHDELIEGAEPIADAHRSGDDLAFILYTGGTTGHAKGVMITHRSFLTGLLSYQMSGAAVRAGGVTMLTGPLFHIGALLGWYSQQLLGGKLVFVPTFSPENAMRTIQEHRVTGCALVPTMIQRICEHPDFASYDLSSLEFIGYGASGTPDSLLELVMKNLPQTQLVHVYGMTEAGCLTMLNGPDHRAGRKLGSVGRATPIVELDVVDPDGNPVPPGTVGQIVTRGGHLMIGYWNKPDETAAAFKDGWFQTGDGGYLDEDGYLWIADRLKDMIITGGENVYSAEVENVLADHPAVASCAVIGIPDPDWGERVHAVLVLRPGHTTSIEEVRAFVKERIASYKAPRSMSIIGEMPMSGVGKILKRELRATIAAD
ncbi:long-chain fatty acid--CoA ligase [Rhodococcus aetherivorans]|uniref:Long-chain fatty acid--CoA ligase n=1 Tax=Rhodococcus aetherivorans TaxID=191292 RepID=A0AA46SDH0_9NOCA|nr:long-chain fatty acid--CoA ligase [Rhodococcus aetherivorans]UYF94052.1 long-chain fatty acid--CoA ligase [Rhodococcus aetherivorans]